MKTLNKIARKEQKFYFNKPSSKFFKLQTVEKYKYGHKEKVNSIDKT